jgi:mannose-6-phosphate isomerase-like protein (cupin superfamily)
LARSGDVIENPVSGERIVFRKTASETNGELLQFDYFLKPNSKGTASLRHKHPKLEERFDVAAGTMCYILGDTKTKSAPSGGRVVVPTGTPHALWNEEDGELQVTTECRPALNIERFFEVMYGLARDGKTNKSGIPGLLQTAVIFREFKSEVAAGTPATKVFAALSVVLAPIGRLRGYKGWYPQYSREERTPIKVA